MEGQDHATIAAFCIDEGQGIDFCLSWGQSHLPPPAAIDTAKAPVRDRRILEQLVETLRL